MGNFFQGGYKKVADTGILDPGGLFNAPKDQWLGGSNAAYREIQDRYKSGQQSGQGQIDQGILGVASGQATLGQAGVLAADDVNQARYYAAQGQDIGGAAIQSQDASMLGQLGYGQAALATAQQQGPSAAQAQMRMGLDQTQRAMMAQAQSARGGNAAAAMRNAQYEGAAMAAGTNQQAAVLRANEEAARRADIMGAQSQLAGISGQQSGMLGQRASMGYGMQGQGLGLSQSGTGQMANIGQGQGQLGLGQANVGVQQQGNYLTAEQEANKAQLEASRTGEDSKAKNKAGVIGGIASAVGGMFG